MNVKKREGSVVPFNEEKIYNAIMKAVNVSKETDTKTIKKLTNKIVDALPEEDIITIEDIQETVETVLIKNELIETAKKYIRYRERRAQLREDSTAQVDVISSMSEYLNREDWRVNANANQGYSIGGLILNSSGKMTANYWLNHIYPTEIGEAHKNGTMHIHDLDMLSPYCSGWSLRDLLEQGFNGVPTKIGSNPPKHFSSAIAQMVNFLGTLQNEWAGAQAFSSFDTYLAPFVYLDRLSYGELKQQIQQFVFSMNVPSRWGSQTPFSNITLDLTIPHDLKDQYPKIGGEYQDFTYGDLQHGVDLINKAFIEVMMDGDYQSRPFTFPIPTYNITKDFDWDSEIAYLLFVMTSKYGTPYFQNFINSDLDPAMIRSMCCRLSLDLTKLTSKGNGLFGSAELTGSIGVVTINLPRLGYIHKNDFVGLLDHLDNILETCKEALELKRKSIEKYFELGLYPYSKRYLGHHKLNNHFSTIGINGMNELIRNFTNDEENITTLIGQDIAYKILDHIHTKMLNYQEETDHMYNLEATPAESASYRFAKEDIKRYSDIITAGTEDNPYYTNSTQLPVNHTSDLFEALELQDDLQSMYTGGTVFHAYIGESITPENALNVVKKTFSMFKLPYLTLTPVFSICPVHGRISGHHEYCPLCDMELAEKKLPKAEE